MWLRIYKVFYFGSFTEFDMMSEKCPQLSRKWRISGKLVWAPNNFKSMSMKFPEFVWYCSLDSEIITIFILDLSLSLTWCRRNDPNCQENERFMENCFSLWTMLKVFRWSLLSFFGTAHVTQKFPTFYFGSFTEFVVMSDECPELSVKRRVSGKLS